MADRIHVPLSHLHNAVVGRTVPSPALRERLPVVLGVPLNRLFTDDALAGTFLTTVGPGGHKRREAEWLTTWDAS